MAQLTHLYVGTGDTRVQEGKRVADGYYKMKDGAAEGTMFTLAFITRKDAELFYGKGNFKKVVFQ